MAMAIGTVAGTFLGFAQISLLPPVKKGAFFATHFFRNAPWLVLLFYCMFLLPFQVTVFGVTIPIAAIVIAVTVLGGASGIQLRNGMLALAAGAVLYVIAVRGGDPGSGIRDAGSAARDRGASLGS